MKQWDVLPMPGHVIQAVEAMAERQDQPLMKDGILNFEWRPGVPIGDDYEEDDHVQMDTEDEGEN